MAKKASATAQPMPTGADVDRWTPPAQDEEFVFEGLDSAPAWIDRNWAGYDRGPALQVPAGDVYGKPPYTTKTARIGDKVVFTAARGGAAAKFDVIPGLPEEGSAGFTQKPVQVTNASLEDLLKGGHMQVGDLGADAAAQVAQRSPELAPHIENGTQIAPPVDETAPT